MDGRYGINLIRLTCEESLMMKKDPLSDEKEDLKTSLMLATGIGTDLALLQSLRQSKTLLVLVLFKSLLILRENGTS